MIYHDLVFNLTLLITLSMFSGFMDNRWSRHTRPGLILQGLLFGGAAVLGMMWPLNLGGGFIFDGRSVMLSLCAMFFGPLSAAIAAVIAIVFRIWLGGAGIFIGFLVVFSSVCIGLIAYYRLKPWVSPPSPGIVYLYGFAVHAAVLAVMLYAPGGLRTEMVRSLILPVIIMYPLAVMLVGMMLSYQIRARHAFDALSDKEERYRQLFESSNDAIFISQLSGADSGIFVEVNDVACKRLGYSREEFLKMSPADIDNKEMENRRRLAISELENTGHAVFEMTQIDKSGNDIQEEISSRVFEHEGKKYVLSIARDIRERKRNEETLKRLNHEMMAIHGCNKVLLRANDEQGLITEICRIICDKAGYRMAWVGYAEDDEMSTIRPVAWAGYEEEYLSTAHITWSDTDYGRGPSGIAVRTGETSFIQDFATEPNAKPWREKALELGYHSSIALPLKDETMRTFGVLNIYSSETDAFIPSEIKLMEELAENLSFGIVTLRTRAERRRAVNGLKSSEEKYRNFFMTSRDCVFITSSNGQWIDFNEAALELFGSPNREELMKVPIPELYENPQERKAFLDLIVGKGYVKEHPFRLRRKDGTVIDTIITATKITGERDTDNVFVGTIRDITENKRMEEALKESEQKFRMLSDQSLMAIGLIQDGLFKYVNQAYCNIIGYSLEEVMKWKPYENAKMVHPDDREYVMDQVEKKQSGHPDIIEHYQFKGLTKHGETKWLDVYSKTVLHRGRPADLATFVDITERVLAEEEIRKLNTELELRVLQRTAQLESLNKDLESFSYSVSHDLRAPLRAISGFASIISRRHRSSLNDEGQHYFDNIVQASERMGRLIDDLLQYSRLGRSGVRFEQVSLSDVLGPLESDLKATIAGTGGTLEIDENLPAVSGDRTLLGQIFVNLLENAVTYRRKDLPIRIEVSCNKDGKDIVVCISDNGIGIPIEYHDKIFNIFQRLHSDDEYPGTGIGLSTVKKSVELLHGKVWVESEPDQGSRFYVRLQGADHE